MEEEYDDLKGLSGERPMVVREIRHLDLPIPVRLTLTGEIIMRHFQSGGHGPLETENMYKQRQLTNDVALG